MAIDGIDVFVNIAILFLVTTLNILLPNSVRWAAWTWGINLTQHAGAEARAAVIRPHPTIFGRFDVSNSNRRFFLAPEIGFY
jgi:hypothetical protein